MNPDRALDRIGSILRKVEDASLVGLLCFTILLAVAQIVLRNLFHSGIPWGDNLIRLAVLWLGLIGAMIASREHRHIRIDVLSRFLSATWQRRLLRLTNLVSALVCAIVSGYGSGFVILEMEQGYRLFDVLPIWIAEAIIPFAFAVMGLRYLLAALHPAAAQAPP